MLVNVHYQIILKDLLNSQAFFVFLFFYKYLSISKSPIELNAITGSRGTPKLLREFGVLVCSLFSKTRSPPYWSAVLLEYLTLRRMLCSKINE